jgi:hypothetical protein
MRSVERLLTRIDDDPWAVLYRIGIGAGVPVIYCSLFGGGSPLALLFFFLAVLGALRFALALLRRLVPFSTEAQAVWKRRRMLAKRYDSYQWRKLFWIGLGVAFYGALAERCQSNSVVVALVFCLSGAGGLVVWRKRCFAEDSTKNISSNNTTISSTINRHE